MVLGRSTKDAVQKSDNQTHSPASQRNDFEAFLEDRIHTIRLLKSVGGQHKLLEPNFCLRGLEQYENSLKNAQFHSSRCLHMKSVLNEQRRQRIMGANDPDQIQQRSTSLSAFALERALHLGQSDALEAGVPGAVVGTKARDDMALRHKKLRLDAPMPCLPHVPRVPIDVEKLREMNQKMLPHVLSYTGQVTPYCLFQAEDCATLVDLPEEKTQSMPPMTAVSLQRLALSTPRPDEIISDKYSPVRRDSLYGLQNRR